MVCGPYFERVTAVCLPVNHLHNIFMNLFSRLVSVAPNVTSTYAIFPYVKVLGVVDVFVGPGLDSVNDTGLEVYKNGSGDISGVVALVVKDIFAVASLTREILEVSVLADAVFLAKLLPELATNFDITKVSELCQWSST